MVVCCMCVVFNCLGIMEMVHAVVGEIYLRAAGPKSARLCSPIGERIFNLVFIANFFSASSHKQQDLQLKPSTA